MSPMRRSFFKSFFFCFMMLLPFVGMSQKIERVRVSLHLKDETLRNAIQLIEQITPYKFLAKTEDIEHELHVSIHAEDQPLNKVLDKILAGRDLEYKQVDKN